MRISIQSIKSLASGGFLTQLHSCFNQIRLHDGLHGINRRIIKITVFAACFDNKEYTQKMSVLNYVLSQFISIKAPVSFISQPPLDSKIMIEVWIIDYPASELTFTFDRKESASVLKLECSEYSCLIASQYSEKHHTFKQNAQEAFNLLEASLLEADFHYSDIVRQWNYIENITMFDTSSDISLQNYQVFNDLRTMFYEKSDFQAGYPSATGIGIENGGCTIEIIALKEKKEKRIFSITNSLQVDAHSYSTNVLVGKSVEEVEKMTTPKFERGKYMNLGNAGFLFISGTASIIGEQTVYPEDITRQTRTTLENIDHLISVSNLRKCHAKIDSQPTLNNYRVYLKNESDYEIVKSICNAHFGLKNGIFVKADICRCNLLVEIEANYFI